MLTPQSKTQYKSTENSNSKEGYNFVEILKDFNYITNSKTFTDKPTDFNSAYDSVSNNLPKEAPVEDRSSSTNRSFSNQSPTNSKNEVFNVMSKMLKITELLKCEKKYF